MALPSPEPIPLDLREAFFNAYLLYSDWDFGAREPRLEIRERWAHISDVFKLVTCFGIDQMPRYLHHSIIATMDATQMDVADALIGDSTYVNGARCLLKLIDSRRARLKTWKSRRRGH
jgi:hypothetical protein